MYDRDETARINKALREWEEAILEPTIKRRPERQEQFSTLSGKKVNRVYTPLDVAGKDYLKDLNFPGGYPFTRGVQPTGYRGQLWTRRQVAGFATPEETNRRLRYLLEEGQTGLNLVCDLPTHHQMDSDDPACEGEVGRDGVPLDTLRDMELVLEGIDLASVSTSLITGGASVMAMFLALGKKRNISFQLLRGTLQNDVLSLYYTVKIPFFPLSLSFRLSTDVIEYCVQNLPHWNPISFVGYQIREVGSTSAQEIAFTLASAVAYTKALIERGLEVDDFAPRFSFFFNAHSDFFEEICKYRAARRLWARLMREQFAARNPRSWLLRYHVQTAGSSLTAQQPVNNVIRTTLQALSAILGGAQSLHTNSMDEAYSLPSEQAVRTALRIQQVIAYESGVTNTVDPLGGSFFVEKLTDQLEEEAIEILREIENRGGMLRAVEEGWVRNQIEDASYRYNREMEDGDRLVVGVNCCQVEEDDVPLEIFHVDPVYEEQQKRSLGEVRRTRDAGKVEEALGKISREVRGDKNLMPFLIEAAGAYASIGEIREACSV